MTTLLLRIWWFNAFAAGAGSLLNMLFFLEGSKASLEMSWVLASVQWFEVCFHTLMSPLKDIFNDCLETRKNPGTNRHDKITPAPKNGLDTYSFIISTSVTSKMLRKTLVIDVLTHNDTKISIIFYIYHPDQLLRFTEFCYVHFR